MNHLSRNFTLFILPSADEPRMIIELPCVAKRVVVQDSYFLSMTIVCPEQMMIFEESYAVSLNHVRKVFTLKSHSGDNELTPFCVHLRPDRWHWYGGPAQRRQYWPAEKLHYEKYYDYVPNAADQANVMERYWLNSNGGFVFMDKDIPLFISQNDHDDRLCFMPRDKIPFNPIQLTIGLSENAVDAHRLAVTHYLKRPIGKPKDTRMIRLPSWSTSLLYDTHVNESMVLQLADDIDRHGFKHSHIAIDDRWETCYGTLRFDEEKFSNMRNLTDHLKARGYRTSLWVHPFVNKECEGVYREGDESKYDE